jgi:hypothetical protein
MKVGFTQTIITPSLDHPVFLAGFGNNRRAESVHDDLFAQALSISDGQTTLVLYALDLIGFFRSDVYEVIQNVKRPDVKIVIASTHTHHVPDTMGLWGLNMKTHRVDDVYQIEIKNKIASTILGSLNSMQTANLRIASIHVSSLAKKARNPEMIDDELAVFQFINSDLRPLVTALIFPCHPEVLWEHNPHITSDYPGYLRDEVEKQTGAPCIFFSGALGGMMTQDVQDHSFAEAEFMGRKLAGAGLEALNVISSEPLSAVRIHKQESRAKLTSPLYKIAFRRKLLPDLRDKKGYITTEVNLIKIGGVLLATVPGAAEGLVNMGIVDAAYRSSRTGKVFIII